MSHSTQLTEFSCSLNSFNPAALRSKTVTAVPFSISFSTIARPSPRTRPGTMAFLPRSSMLDGHAPLSQHPFDLIHTLHGYDLVETQLNVETLLQSDDEFHMLQRIPGI